MSRAQCGWFVGCVIGIVSGGAVSAADWPGFRGPQGNGIADAGAKPALKWDRETNIAWKVELPAPGNSSPIIKDRTVYVVSADKEGKTLSLLALDRATGAERWRKSVSDDTPEPTHNTNPYGSPTPAADDARVVVWYGDAGLHAYAHDGKELWTVATPAVRHIWGYGSSPVLQEGRVYLNTGIGEESFLAAYDAATGTEIWKTPEVGGTAGTAKGGGWIGTWSTPLFANIHGQTQLLCAQPTRVNAYDPQTGEILWYVEGLANLPRGNLVYTSLMLGDDVGVAMGGYNGPAIGFRLGGSGNVTEANRLWRNSSNNPQRIGSAVVLGENVYMANSGPGLMQCLDPRTGEERWKARPEIGGNFWGSVVHAAGRLYVTNQEGNTLVFAPNPEKFEVLAENRLDEHCNATPAIADGDLMIRTYQHVYCIREMSPPN